MFRAWFNVSLILPNAPKYLIQGGHHHMIKIVLNVMPTNRLFLIALTGSNKFGSDSKKKVMMQIQQKTVQFCS
jgi:hypothetical protein